MLPAFLVPETTTRQSGISPEIEIGSFNRELLITLGITRIVEQESLDIAVWASSDNSDWGTKPLLRFPQKFYCGTYSLMLDLSAAPDVRYLRVEYKMNRWGRGDLTPLFGFYVFAADAGVKPSVNRAVA
jgi:hypothetical protein